MRRCGLGGVLARSLPAVVTTTAAAAALRQPRRLLFTATLAAQQQQQQQQQQPPPAPSGSGEECDFVDVDGLAVGTLAKAGEHHVLGVERRVVPKEGTEFSRFAIPLESPRRGQPIPRPNSRAVFQPGEEAGLVERQQLCQQKASSEGGEAPRTEEATGERTEGGGPVDAAVALANALVEDSRAGGAGDPLPKADATLPYDDEAFAETLLQMEVDGVIDEAWQDARKAHLEDVKEVMEVLRSLKVRDLCCIDVSGKTSNFDYMLFGTCEGPRHIHLAAWAAQEADSLRRVAKVPRRKTDELWEVVPIGRIVLNLMVESLRDELALERKWAVTKTMDPLEAANAPVSEGRNVRAHGLWTLTLNLQDLEDFEVDYCKDVLLHQL